MSISDLSEEEIVIKIKELKKDENLYSSVIKSYFEELYNRYYFQCYNIARYYGLARQDAEDAVQEAFLRFMMRVSTFDKNKSFKPWFFRILMNTIKDKYKYLKRIRYADIEVFENIHTEENKYEEFQIKEVLKKLVNNLPEKLKTVVLLRNYTEMSLEDIAKASGISVRQLHNRLSKAYSIILKDLK